MKKLTSNFKMYCTAIVIVGMSVFFLSCNMDQNSSTNATDTAAVTTVGPSPSDTSAASINAITDSSKMNSDTAMQKPMTSSKIKKTGKVSTKIETGNSAKMEMDKTGIYGRAEVMPMFPGGEGALDNYLSNHIQYPEAAMDNGTEGTVTVQFAVDEHGKVYEPKEIGNKIGDGLDEEALKVVAGMPQWTPGKIKGKNVKTYYTLPVIFTLQ